jgi:hypothetical protein
MAVAFLKCIYGHLPLAKDGGRTLDGRESEVLTTLAWRKPMLRARIATSSLSIAQGRTKMR